MPINNIPNHLFVNYIVEHEPESLDTMIYYYPYVLKYIIIKSILVEYDYDKYGTKHSITYDLTNKIIQSMKKYNIPYERLNENFIVYGYK